MLHMLMIDALDASTLAQLQKSLQQISTLLALQRHTVSDSLLGLCMIKYPTAKDVQLQVLQRPAPFSLRQWQLAVQKLTSVQTACVPDSSKAALAVKSLVEHMATDKTLAKIYRSVTIVGHAFQSAGAFAKVLQYAAEKCIQVHFVAIAHSNPDGTMHTSEADLAAFAAGLCDFESASASYCPCDPHAIHQVCLQWLRTIVQANPTVVTIEMPIVGSSSTVLSSLRLNPTSQHCAATSSQAAVTNRPADSSQQPNCIICQAVSEVMSLCQKLEHPEVCPCHALPVLRSHQQTADGFVGCPVTGAALDRADMQSDASAVMVGMREILMMPSAQAAHAADRSYLPSSSEYRSPPQLKVIQRLKVQDVSEALLFGCPTILTPHGDSFDSICDMQANEQKLAALCQVLHAEQEALLVSSYMDLDTQQLASWPLHYILRPASNGCTALLRRLASCEHLLPLSHGLPTQLEEIPQQVKNAMQDCLQALPLSAYLPLQHSSGACQMIEELVSHSVSAQATPARTPPAVAQPATVAAAPMKAAPAPSAHVEGKRGVDAQPPQEAVKQAAKSYLVTSKPQIMLPAAPVVTAAPQHARHKSRLTMPVHVQQRQLQSDANPSDTGCAEESSRRLGQAAQTGAKLHFKRIRTSK